MSASSCHFFDPCDCDHRWPLGSWPADVVRRHATGFLAGLILKLQAEHSGEGHAIGFRHPHSGNSKGLGATKPILRSSRNRVWTVLRRAGPSTRRMEPLSKDGTQKKNCTTFRPRESYKAASDAEGMRKIGILALIVLVTGVVASLSVAQEAVVTSTDDLFVGFSPDPLVIEVVTGSIEHGPSSRCVDYPTEAGHSETSSRIGAILESVEAHQLGAKTVRASVECDPFCRGHFQGPDSILGRGTYGGRGTYYRSSPTQFAYGEGCIDRTVRLPGNACECCSADRQRPHPPVGGIYSD